MRCDHLTIDGMYWYSWPRCSNNKRKCFILHYKRHPPVSSPSHPRWQPSSRSFTRLPLFFQHSLSLIESQCDDGAARPRRSDVPRCGRQLWEGCDEKVMMLVTFHYKVWRTHPLLLLLGSVGHHTVRNYWKFLLCVNLCYFMYISFDISPHYHVISWLWGHRAC